MKTLVTGGVRSGKSAHAESLLEGREAVDYVAPGPVPDGADEEWSQRVQAHQQRRPTSWTTVESTDVAGAVREAGNAVLVDCLGTWVTAVMDEIDGWDRLPAYWAPKVDDRLDALVEALRKTGEDVVLVTNEVGMGVVPSHASGRRFRDIVGMTNRRVAEVCDEVHLVIAGRVLVL